MSKILLSALIVFICFTGCTNESKPGTSTTDEAKRNVEISNLINEAYRTGDASKVDSVVSPDYIDHTDRGDMKGIDSLKAGIRWIHENMRDMKIELRKQWADNEYVSSWMHYTGTNSNAMPGFPAGPYDWTTIELTRYKNGKLVEHWGFMEVQSVVKMMQPANGITNTIPDSTGRKVP